MGLNCDRRHKSWLVHRLVAEAFLGQCPSGIEVNHKNGKRSDNRIENLEYVTRRENLRHAIDAGLWIPKCRIPPEKALHIGEKNGRSKLTEEDVRSMRIAHSGGEATRLLARRFDVSKSTVWNIVSLRKWRHVQ